METVSGKTKAEE